MIDLKDNINEFYSLFADEYNTQCPINFLLNLWERNQQRVIELIEESVSNLDNYRDISQCICNWKKKNCKLRSL